MKFKPQMCPKCKERSKYGYGMKYNPMVLKGILLERNIRDKRFSGAHDWGLNWECEKCGNIIITTRNDLRLTSRGGTSIAETRKAYGENNDEI